MPIIKSVLIFVLAGFCEISGGYLVWLWLKEGKPLWYGLLGALILALYGVVATLQASNFAESHHSLAKAASITGLGLKAVKEIPVNEYLQIDISLLEQQIKDDIKNNFFPVMIVATIGTTGAGAIDAINEIATIASSYNIWLHADTAYGGALVLSDQYKALLGNIHLADSITFDAHKSMSVPMSTSMFITKNTDILNETFRVTTDYMPKEANDLQVSEPFAHSIQWSRRFTGLKVYLSLLIFGWEGYKQVIEEQIKIGNILRDRERCRKV